MVLRAAEISLGRAAEVILARAAEVPLARGMARSAAGCFLENPMTAVPLLRLLRISICLPTLVAVAAARDKAPAGFYEHYTGFAMSPEPVLPARETHPSLWFSAAEIPALKGRLNADDFARPRWAAVQKLADLHAPLPAAPAATDKVEKIHKYYGAMSIAARAHAFVALFADDASARAAHRARAIELLLRAYDGPIFQLDSKVQGSAVDEIYRGSWLQNYAHAYDCVQPSLDRETDAKIRTRLASEAECVAQNLFAWTPTSPHNHLSKPAWGLGSIALALSAHPSARAWLGRALEAANKNTRYFFSGDGIYREGSHYLTFSLTNFLPFLYHYRNVSGVDGFATFQPAFEAMVEARNSRGWLPNIEDSYIRPTPTHLAAAAYRTARTRLSTVAPLGEILTWSYATGDLSPFENERAESGLNYTGASWDYPLELDELLTHDPSLRATAPDVAPNIFLAGGQSYFRDSWSNRGAGQRYLLFHGVAVADNHNHDDQLSFILEAEGQMMCSDAGYSRGTYTGAERTAWYNTAPAHNTLTFDGKPAVDAAPSATPPSLFHVAEPGLVGEEKEAFFGPDGKTATWRRAIFWVAGDYYVIVDRVNATRAGRIGSYLHGGRGTLATDGARRTWTYADDRYGRAARLHVWLAALGASVAEKKGELTYIKGDYAEFPYLEIQTTDRDASWLTLLKPSRLDEPTTFAVQDLRGKNYSAWSIAASDHQGIAIAQAKPGTRIEAAGVETDAAFALVRRDLAGNVQAFAVLDATRLAVGGKEIWRSEKPASAARASIR
jgi:hypothetical protein